MEQATKDASAFHQNHGTPDPPTDPPATDSAQQSRVFRLDKKSKKCMSCGKTGHVLIDCRFYNATCRSCNKRGHISTVCMSTLATDKNTPPEHKPTHCLEEQDFGGEPRSTHCLEEQDSGGGGK